jgi:hypothetical protein
MAAGRALVHSRRRMWRAVYGGGPGARRMHSASLTDEHAPLLYSTSRPTGVKVQDGWVTMKSANIKRQGAKSTAGATSAKHGDHQSSPTS